jgi:hypothetical protein
VFERLGALPVYICAVAMRHATRRLPPIRPPAPAPIRPQETYGVYRCAMTPQAQEEREAKRALLGVPTAVLAAQRQQEAAAGGEQQPLADADELDALY